MKNRFARAALLAGVALGLAACGGGGGGGSVPTPPITLNGVSYWAPEGDNSNFVIRESEGGSGSNFGDVIYVDDSFSEILAEQTSSAGSTTTFRIDSDNFVTLAVPGADPDFEDIRFMNLVYRKGSTTYGSLGVVGRFTSLANMASATGMATYTGTGTALVTGLVAGGQYSAEGDTQITVTFGGGGSVNVLLDGFTATSGPGTAPFDSIVITGATINGNRFEGGNLEFYSGATQVLLGGTRDHGGIFAGWNDGNNGMNRPAEVGGAFTATTPTGVASGIYAGD